LATAGLCIISLFACTPDTSAKAWKTYAPIAAEADFVIFETEDPVPAKDGEKLGQIVLNQKDGDYPAALDTMMAVARSWGANALKINSHQQSLDVWLGRPYHRVEATALRLSHLSAYFKTLPWNKRRPLRTTDFLADTANRPFIAMTMSSISLYWEMHPTKKEAIVQARALFTRPMSYFKDRPDSLRILAHEQGHFDIAEIYARKFRQSLTQRIFDIKTLNEDIRQLYDRNYKALQEFQDHYDHDVYADPRKQKTWLAQIKTELDRYAAYSQDKVVLQLNSRT
jgi:hypothetical protein